MKYNDQSVDIGRRLYYSSSQGPFYNANNIFMFYGGGSRGKIVEKVIRAVNCSEPVVHVHGEAGSGKTMLSLVVCDRIKHRFHTIRYDLPEISAAKLLRHLLIELAPQSSDLISHEQAQCGADEVSIETALCCLEQQLIQVSHSQNYKPYVLIVDSRDSLDAGVLKVIERLTACCNDSQRIFCSVLFQTATSNAEFYSAIGDTPYQSANHHWLRRLTLAEINEYLHHHMMLFDFTRRNIFTREMAYFIADSSEGLFKSVNTLARTALTIANLENEDTLSMSHLLSAGLPLPKEPVDAPGFMSRHGRSVLYLTSMWLVGCSAFVVYLVQ